MKQVAALARGLIHRGGSTLMIFVVALVAAAAAAAGPAYYAASKTRILQDTMTSATITGRGYEVTQTGPVASLLDPLHFAVQAELAGDLGGQRVVQRVFQPATEELDASLNAPGLGDARLVWRTGVCAHLHITGACPAAAGQVLISSSMARVNSWHVGQRLHFPPWGTLTVTGIYRLADTSQDYWFARGPTYFPYELGGSGNALTWTAPVYDATFTPESTITAAPSTLQGTGVIDDVLDVPRLRESEVGTLSAGMVNFANSEGLGGISAVPATDIPATIDTVRSSWTSLAVPVVLITAQLLAVAWLLLFLAVTDAAEARGPEIALAKLRGHGRWRTVFFGLSEPVALLALALPLGALAGWAATIGLGRVLLGKHVPVAMPPLGWAAAGLATVGGLVAVILAARRTIRRPVVEQWRRAGRRAADRGWVVDAILLTGAAAGLAEIVIGGQIGSAKHGALGLLVPGLLGLAVGVVASRVLPLGCRATFGRTSRRGGIGRYLALRHIARRPGGVRTTMMLATAFALAAFAVTAWSVGRGNYRLAADAQVGGPEVLTVSVPQGADLGTIVDRADPGGRLATTVDSYASLSSGTSGEKTLGVDPERFARIAAWHRSFSARPLAAIAAGLAAPAPPPVMMSGDAMRVTISVLKLSPAGGDLVADVHVSGSIGATPLDLGRLPARGTATLTVGLFGCPCRLVSLYLNESGARSAPPIVGAVTLTGLQVHTAAGWQPGGAVFGDVARWRAGSLETLAAGPAGLRWNIDTPPRQNPTLVVIDRPSPLPAIVTAAPNGGHQGNFTGVGLDGSAVSMRAIASAAALPGAPDSGVIVDRRYAELEANDNLYQVNQQVWLAAGARHIIEPRLAAAGVHVLSDQSAVATAAQLGRQGPGLASVLLLADAGAAALLAAGAAILGLYLSARRRRYEYAALAATGVRRGALRGALLIEQSVVLGFGTLVGLGTGLAAAAFVLRDVPEFVTPPAAPPLSYAPAGGQAGALLGIAVAVLLIAAVTASGTLIHSVDLDQLREAPP